jgi:hypothetical protein
MKKLISYGVISLIIIAVIVLFLQFKKPEKVNTVSSPYQTYMEMISRLFPKLIGVKKCFWVSGVKNKNYPLSVGISSHWYKGYMIITNNETKRIRNKYKWCKTPLRWKPSFIKNPFGITHSKCNWIMSQEYNNAILDYGRYGTIYFDKDHSLLYFEINRDG